MTETGATSHHALNDAPVEVSVDVIVFGGGIAGLWTLAVLQKAGYKAVLLESQALGAGQTRYAQGIIHGGTKYALTGKLTASSEAVADMPSRWRDCYEGNGEPDLSQAELLSDAHYLWSTTSLTSRISGFFASKVMRSRSTELDSKSLPAIFQHKDFKGQFYRLDEPVFNTMTVIRALAEPRKQTILMIDPQTLHHEGDKLKVSSSQGVDYRFHFKKIIFNAGEGNEELISRFKSEQPRMQRRPLKMVVMRGVQDDMIYAHCLGASVNPRITITSHRDAQGKVVWYMGGQLAEDGVNKTDIALVKAAKKELSELIPWLDLNGAEWGVLEINRAEIKKPGTTRPDTFSIEQHGDVITAWPTKLALAPVLADELVDMLQADNVEKSTDQALPEWAPPVYAELPWDEDPCWLPPSEVDV
ncbi:MAG: FAD-dependent oxidoreductase [Gammaproteobacteria bacterium]|nr:FAD-dependent oxidoreductase [Gammaproteobacteria bacterium]NNJ49134.1 FAD-dependent oxidoreductase [Gammaproteobacteria bacterium]